MLILASASPRRRELMKMITDFFIVASADVDETIPKNMDCMKVSEYLAEKKARAIKIIQNDVIVGCDTTVICDNKILGKPKNKEEARLFMYMLSGRVHYVCTGCCIVCGDKICSFTETTEVTFRSLKKDEIEKYISTDEPYDKAGGYGIQGKGALLIEKINGDYFNVVGLPVSRLNQALKKFL